MYLNCVQFILKVEYCVPKVKYIEKNKLHKVTESLAYNVTMCKNIYNK